MNTVQFFTNDFFTRVNSLKFNTSEFFKNIIAKVKGEKMGAYDIPEKLFDFAYMPNFAGKIKYLADNLAEEENWKPTVVTPFLVDGEIMVSHSPEYPILANYILNIHRRISKDERDKFFVAEDGNYSCWNTGLLTPLKEDIFIVFKKNGAGFRQYWEFSGFYERSHRLLVGFGENLPEMCDFGKNPADLVFNARADIVPDLEHILNDHPERYPEIFNSQHERLRRNALSGAIVEAKEKVKRNFNVAVPQYFSGNIQLLIPLYLTKDTPDLALVLERANNLVYRANTVLPLDWAYNNARVIKKPDADWLQV